MSVAGVHRQYGLGPEPCAISAARRVVTPEHLRFVEANIHRMGWQGMARACGVNQTDLKTAYDRSKQPASSAAKAGAPKAPAQPSPALPARDPGPPTDIMIAVLRAIQLGARRSMDIAEACEITPSHARTVVMKLKLRGVLSGHGNNLAGWVIPDAGLKLLKKAARDV